MATKTKPKIEPVEQEIVTPTEQVVTDKTSKPAKKLPGKTLSFDEMQEAFNKHSDKIGIQFAATVKAKLIRHYGPEFDQYTSNIDESIFDAAVIDKWFEPLLAIHTFKYTKGDVVTAYIDENGNRVPFKSLFAFLACQVDHSQLWEKRVKCWTDMYFKGQKYNDADWKAQYLRERNVEYTNT